PVGPQPKDAEITSALRTGHSDERRTGDGAVIVQTSLGLSGTLVARTVVPREVYHEGVAETTAMLAALGFALLLGAMFAADRLGRRVSAPVRRLAGAAQAMRDGNLDVRLPERGTPEVIALATALNQLAARVQKLLGESRDSV